MTNDEYDDLRERLRALERDCTQKEYFIFALVVAVIFDTAGMLWLWQERGVPNFDHIAVALTVFQTLFGLGALYGFWSLRALTRERAEQVAKEEVAEIAPPIIRRAVGPIAEKILREGILTPTQVDDMIDTLSDGKEVEDGS